MRIPDTNLFEWFDDFKKREDISKLNYSTEDLIELWLEINSPSLTNNQYISLTPDLKKKFISLGMDLNKIQLENSETTVLNYYIKKKIEKILKKRLSDLNETDVILLNTPMLKNEKISLKDKFLKEVRVQDPKKPNEVNIDLRERSSNREITRFTQLYGVEELFKSIDPNIDYFSVVADKDSSQDVKKIVSKLEKMNRPERVLHRKVLRPWGWYDTIDIGDRFKVKRILVNPNSSLSLQKHFKRAEHWVVVRGLAEVT